MIPSTCIYVLPFRCYRCTAWLYLTLREHVFLPQEKEACQALRNELEDERRRALRMEARVEEQLAEFDTEREQLRSRLKKEEAHCCQLQQQV